MVSIFDASCNAEIPEKQYLSVPLVIRGGGTENAEIMSDTIAGW
jgi:hypothetical protein